MTKAETEFNEILNSRKRYFNKPIKPETEDGSLRNYLADTLLYRENNPELDSIYQNQIKIMESGIFYKGGLKGKVLLQTQLGRVTEWQVWPISNLDELLSKLTVTMIAATEHEKTMKEHVSGKLDNLLIAFDGAAPILRWVGVRKSSRDKMKQDLLNWNKKPIPKKFTFPKTTPNKIAKILLAYLPPKTPDLTIANRINELMAAFNQEESKIETLRRKVGDMRKK